MCPVLSCLCHLYQYNLSLCAKEHGASQVSSFFSKCYWSLNPILPLQRWTCLRGKLVFTLWEIGNDCPTFTSTCLNRQFGKWPVSWCHKGHLPRHSPIIGITSGQMFFLSWKYLMATLFSSWRPNKASALTVNLAVSLFGVFFNAESLKKKKFKCASNSLKW